MSAEHRWERVILVLATFFLFVALVVMSALLIEVQSIKTSSHHAEQAATSVNNGIDKRTPARRKEQAQIDRIERQLTQLLKEVG